MIGEICRLLSGRPDPKSEAALALLADNAMALGGRAAIIADRLGLDSDKLSTMRVPYEFQMLVLVPVLEKILDRIEAIENGRSLDVPG